MFKSFILPPNFIFKKTSMLSKLSRLVKHTQPCFTAYSRQGVAYIYSFIYNICSMAWYMTTKDSLLQLMIHSQEMTAGLKFEAGFSIYLKSKSFVTLYMPSL